MAKNFVESALHHSKDLIIGNGPQGPFDHLFRLKCTPYNVGSQQRFNPDSLFLYAVTDSRMNKKWGHSIEDAVKAAIEGGATIVQLRSGSSCFACEYLLLPPSQKGCHLFV